MFPTVSLGGGFELNGSFGIYVTITDIPIRFECQVADSWRHKFDLWRHRGDTVSFMSTIHPKYSTEMYQNTTFYAELNGEYAGEGFMPLRSIVLEIWTRKTKKITEFPKIWPLTCHNWVKYWPRTKNNTTNREYSASAIYWSFPRSYPTLCLETPRGGGGRTTPSPFTGEGGKTPFTGEGLSSKNVGMYDKRFASGPMTGRPLKVASVLTV